MTACSPAFDWRSQSYSNHGDRYTVVFPGKALSAKKTVLLNAESLPLTLNGVQVQSAQFVLGTVPARNAAHAQALAQALAQAFAGNLKVQGTVGPLTLSKTLGAFDVRYPTNERYAQARFIWTDQAAYELLVLGLTADLPPEEADTFIRSIKFD